MAKQVKQKKVKITFGPASVYCTANAIGFPTIEKGCNAFGLTAVKCGWSIKAGARFENAPNPDPALKDVTLWFPNAENQHWNNNVKGSTIIETPKDPSKNALQVNNFLNRPELRITFMKDDAQWNGYKFIGVYELDINATKSRNACVWKQITSIPCIHSDLREIKQYLQSQNQKHP